MSTIEQPTATIETLSEEAFAPFGEFADLSAEHPSICEGIVTYSPDIMGLELGDNKPSVCVCRVLGTDKVIGYSEYHANTEEGFLPIDGDIIVHVAAANSGEKYDVKDAKVFRVPAGTFIRLKKGTWHGAPLAAGDGPTNVLVMLPHKTHEKDCIQFLHGDDEQIQLQA